MSEDESKKIRVELDHEQKVIRLGCWFYDLKGVLIAEATDEDKEKYHCGKFMTYPIVDDDWEVREDDCIKDGIADLVVGKKGETVPLSKLQDVLDLNAEERSGDYSDILVDVENVTVSPFPIVCRIIRKKNSLRRYFSKYIESGTRTHSVSILTKTDITFLAGIAM